MKLKILLASFITILCGCQSQVTQTYFNHSDKPGGYTVAGLRVNLTSNHSYLSKRVILQIRGIENGFMSSFTQYHGPEDHYSLVNKMPVGEYELYGITVIINAWGGKEITYTQKEKFSFKFKVALNQVSYLGNFLQNISQKGGSIPEVGYFQVSDSQNLNISQASVRFPIINQLEVINYTKELLQQNIRYFQSQK